MDTTRAQPDTDAVTAFIDRWERSGAAERANHQLFISELCDLIGVPHPDPATPDNSRNAYVFERAVTFQHGDGKTSSGFIDLYKRGCLLLEAKQGADAPSSEEPLSEAAQELRRKLKIGHGRRGSTAWDDAMIRARGQAEQYIRALPAEEGRPPFLMVIDVGHSLELFSEFSCTGGAYVPFPAPGSHRIFLNDLQRSDIRDRLKAVWTEPSTLDPTRRSARVTREIAGRLARLAQSLEKARHDPHIVAGFLMRCLFTMFAEDVRLIPPGGFTRLLESLRDTPEHFVPMVEELWDRMNRGGFSTTLRTNILQFNGGLFQDATALPLTRDQVQLLIEAAQSDWRDVEPAIFGTLLERALDPVERHKLGAHYTPRAYVERLVMPTIINPVREEWAAVQVAAVTLANQGEMKKAVGEVKTFHRKLCQIRVLDPACGSGNFLYVTLEHLKRIEGEVFDTLDSMGERQSHLDMAGETVDPHQLLGLEVNPRAAAIAELVLWIGTLQWHFRNRGNVQPPQPIIRNFHNIECRDALIEWDAVEEVVDEEGRPVTHWDGRTTKPHPVTGKEVPDETARTPVYRYINPRKAEWPAADYIVGNPPFIGARRIREALGDPYLSAVRGQYPEVPENCDYVLYWWHIAALLVGSSRVKSFGLITTNTITQSFARKLLNSHMKGSGQVSITMAIPDHPWVQSEDGAAVRIAMTVGVQGAVAGEVLSVASEGEGNDDGAALSFRSNKGVVFSDLSVGADVSGASLLTANAGMSCVGYQLTGQGFIMQDRLIAPPDEWVVIHPLLTARDITDSRPLRWAIDFTGLDEAEVRCGFPFLYQWIIDRVLPERRTNNRSSVRDNWWWYGERRLTFRPALRAIGSMVVTALTSKHRFFIRCGADTLADSTTVMFALDDALFLGVLSSRAHVCWALASGGTLEDRPRYNKTRCFETFPFPDPTPAQAQRIRELAEQLDAHRKRRQEQHPDLTMTGMYNVLEKLRSGEALTAKEKSIHEQGLVSVLKQLHDELDAAVFTAYDWHATLTDSEILERLVALNAERAAEEAQGKIRWLRPDYQNPGGAGERQGELAVGDGERTPNNQQPTTNVQGGAKRAWPAALPEQVRVVREVLIATGQPVTAEAIARHFTRARTDRVTPILQTLVTVGQAREAGEGWFVGG